MENNFPESGRRMLNNASKYHGRSVLAKPPKWNRKKAEKRLAKAQRSIFGQ